MIYFIIFHVNYIARFFFVTLSTIYSFSFLFLQVFLCKLSTHLFPEGPFLLLVIVRLQRTSSDICVMSSDDLSISFFASLCYRSFNTLCKNFLFLFADNFLLCSLFHFLVISFYLKDGLILNFVQSHFRKSFCHL